MTEQSETNGPPMERPDSALMCLTHGGTNAEPVEEEAWSVNTMALTRRVKALEIQADRSAQIVTALNLREATRPTLEEFDGLRAENAAMRERLAALETQMQGLSLRRSA